ncbi:unnamed protein product [Brassica rapa]|uniref:Uncharacterized protein n=1 Tax=Brassica campestris TaxID=3711 RepID=A0A8D9HKH8_BRACM|nr:unnamed protein product [Brassica rapa]
MASMIPQIKGRIWDQWATIPVSPDWEEVRSGIHAEADEVNQLTAPINDCSFGQSTWIIDIQWILPTFRHDIVIDFERSLSMGSRANRVGERWNLMGYEEKSSVIQEEIKRVSKLPSNSVYAVHRLKVLNKINELLSVQRTLSQEKELELLFTQLSL